ncbi:hypothetical protein LJR175_007620 [Variovorax sp. LjRoot175]
MKSNERAGTEDLAIAEIATAAPTESVAQANAAATWRASRLARRPRNPS